MLTRAHSFFPLAIFVLVLATLVVSCTGEIEPIESDEAQQGNDRPNVIIVLADDMGWGDASSYGHPLIRTPHIDQLAAQGQRWNSFYSAGPFCNPSRIALMTGRMPIRIQGTGLNQWGNLPEDEITLGQLFQDAGYVTGYVGKWGMSGRFESGGVHPNDAGFDSFYGVEDYNDGYARDGLENTYETLKNATSEDFRMPLFRQKELIEQPAHQPTLTKRYTEEAVRFIEQQLESEQSFFLFLGHTMPHVPIFASEEFLGTSQGGLYGDVIEEIDWSLGEIVRTLEEGGGDKNTLVIFTSDNGPWRTVYDLGGSAGPFRDGKMTAWEGAFRVPNIFWWPGTIEPSVAEGIGVGVDFMATLASLTPIELPRDRVLDSIDLSQTLLEGSPSARTEWFYYGQPGNLWAARVGSHKLVLESWESIGFEGGDVGWRGFANRQVHDPPLLFDLSTDLGERLDIADQQPMVVEAIQQTIERYHASLVSGRP